MRRLILSALIAVILLVPAISASAQQGSVAYERYDNSIRFNAGSLLVGLLTGSLNIGVGYERRIQDNLGIGASVAFVRVSGASGAGVSVGANYYFSGTALHGWYGNAGAGFSVVTAYPYSLTQYSIGISGGYQWVMESAFVLRLGGGVSFVTYSGVVPSIVIALGYAF